MKGSPIAQAPNPPAGKTGTVRALQILTAGALGMTALLALLPQAGHDQLWLLLAAARTTPFGNPYGPLVFESNPPLAIWLSQLVTGPAQALHLSPGAALKLAVCLVAVASAAVSARLLKRLCPNLARAQGWFLAFSFTVVFGAVPARDFAQRDHLLALLVLPYLLLAASAWNREPHTNRVPHHARAEGEVIVRSFDPAFPATRTAITLAAALGIALKPHQALIPFSLETALLLRVLITRRKPLPTKPPLRLLEPAIFLLAGAAYLLAIHLRAPTYLTEVLPILRQTYWAFGSLSVPQLFLAAIELHVLLAAVLVLRFRPRRTGPTPATVDILLLAGLAATLAFYLQGTGWYYQQLPAISFLALALALELLQWIPQPAPAPQVAMPPRRHLLPGAAAALTLLALALTTYVSDFHWQHGEFIQPQPTPDPAFFAGLPPGAAVATLTTTVDDTVPPAFLYHLTLAQRYPHLWMLPAILRNESPGSGSPLRVIPSAQLAQLDALQHRFMVQDLDRWHPQLILVERCQDPAVHCQILEDRHDDLLAWFGRDPAFAQIFAHYRRIPSHGPFDAYRREQGPPSP